MVNNENAPLPADSADLDFLYLDSETTGIPAAGNEALSVSIIDAQGTVLLDTLVRPVAHTSWPEAEVINGIKPADVLRDDLPTMSELAPRIAEITRGRRLAIYNAPYDCDILAEALSLGPPAEVLCVMDKFATYYGDWNEYRESYTWQNLRVAASHVLHEWHGSPHGSLPDCFAAKDVLEFLLSPARQQEVAEEKDRRSELRYEQSVVSEFLARLARTEQQRRERLNEDWTAAYFARLPHVRPVASYGPTRAQASADVFCQQLTSYPVLTWNAYGPKLKLRRYENPPAKNAPKSRKRPRPDYLAREDAGPILFMRRTWRPANQPQLLELRGPAIEPVAMQVLPGFGAELRLAPLFDLRPLTVGVDYVPYATKWLDDYCTATDLKRKYKLKPAQIAQLRPAYFRRGTHQSYYLYPVPVPVAVETNG